MMGAFKRPTVDDALREHFDSAPWVPSEFDQRALYTPQIGKVEQIATPTGRVYKIVDSGRVYPSMSRVCELLSAEAIAAWKERIAKQGPDEAARISRAAAGRGTKIHRLAETYLTRDTAAFAEAWQAAMPDARANWRGVRRAIDQNINKMYASEQPLFSDALRLGGTTDFIGEYGNKRSVLDFKTSAKLKKREWIDGYFIQCSGYAQMWMERTGMEVEQLVLMIAVDGQPKPQIFIEPVEPNLRELKKLRLEFYKQKGM